MRFQGCNWTENSQIYSFRDRNNFRCKFWRQIFIFRLQWKRPKLFLLKSCFRRWKLFCSIYDSLWEKWRWISGWNKSNFSILCCCCFAMLIHVTRCSAACSYSSVVFILFNNHFSHITFTVKCHRVSVHWHNENSFAKMANLNDLESKRKLSCYSYFETRSLNVFELMESIFGLVPINPVNIEPSIFNEDWPLLKIVSDVDFTFNSPLVPYILCSVNVKPTDVLKLFRDQRNLTWELVNNIPSRRLTNITKDSHHAVTRNFANSIKADMDFRHCPSPYCFVDQIINSCMGFFKRIMVHVCSYGNWRPRFLRFIKQRNHNLMCFYFIHRYSLPRKLLSLSWKPYGINAAWSLWTWDALFTVNFWASQQFDFSSTSSRSRRFKSGHGFTNNFIRMGRQYYIKSTSISSNAGWVHFWCASW